MRFVFAVSGIWAAIQVTSAQTVSIRNATYPGTALEVDDFVEVRITGAAPYAGVTLFQNGAPPFYWGTTDDLGNWSTLSLIGEENVDEYDQRWYVDGIEAQPTNPRQEYLPFAPRLPIFNVYSKFTGTNDPPPTLAVDTCGGLVSETRWRWTPVTYDVDYTSYGFEAVRTAAGWWNSATQNRVELVPHTAVRDIVVYDDELLTPDIYAITRGYNQRCSPCSGRIDECTGACMNDSAMFVAFIALNASEINNLSSHLDTTPTTLATAIIAHELGHALRLGHPRIIEGKCSEVRSTMYPEAGTVFACGITEPRPADTTAIYSLYPTSPTFCPIGGNYCLDNSCQ